MDSVEGIWNSGRDEQPNLGYKPRHKEGYFPVPPHDSLQDVRSHIINKMIETGIPVEVHHHEVATAGQNEIDMRYSPLVKMADNCMMYKYYRQEHGPAVRHGGDVYAKAALWR